MTAVCEYDVPRGPGETLAPTLRLAHETWIQETDRFFLPVVLEGASFWSRWTAVRFLADQFAAQHRREWALLEELRPFLQQDILDRLLRDGERIMRLQGELDRVGRRRGVAHTVSVLSRRLLNLLRTWCAEIEEAAGEIRRENLTLEGDQALRQMELYARVQV